jgi:hypothetical protein
MFGYPERLYGKQRRVTAVSAYWPKQSPLGVHIGSAGIQLHGEPLQRTSIGCRRYSLKNYATVRQSQFNGTDSQRWQLLA